MSAATSSVRAPPEKRFLDNVCELCQLTRDIVTDATAAGMVVPVQPYIIDIARGVVSGMDPHKVINTFLTRSFPHWDKIKVRDVEFFKAATPILFDGAPKEHVDAFVALYDAVKPDGSKLFDEAREAEYFAFFEAMIRQCICYIHQQRKPDPTTKKYTCAAYPDIMGIPVSVKALVEKWEVKRLD